MLAHQIGVVICRVGAAVLIVQAIRGLGFVVPAVIGGPGEITPALLGGILLGLLPGLAAAGLWIFAERIAGVPSTADDATDSAAIEAGDIVRVGTLLIGLYLAVTGIIEGFSVEVSDYMQPKSIGMPGGGSRYDAQVAGMRVTYLLKIGFGAALMLGGDRLAEIATKLRRAGTDA